METLNYINIDKEELENEIGTEIKSADDLVDYMRKNDADEVDNGAESVFRLELKSGKCLFFETVNDVVSIEPSESWNGYFAQWDEGEDKALERFCLGKEISYEVAEPDYDGEVRIYIKYNEIDPIYCRDGWSVTIGEMRSGMSLTQMHMRQSTTMTGMCKMDVLILPHTSFVRHKKYFWESQNFAEITIVSVLNLIRQVS